MELSRPLFIIDIMAMLSTLANGLFRQVFRTLQKSCACCCVRTVLSLAAQDIQRGYREPTCQGRGKHFLREMISFFNIFVKYCSRPVIDTKGVDVAGRMQMKQPKIHLFLKGFCHLHVHLYVVLLQ